MRAWVRVAAALTRTGGDIRAHGARMPQKSPRGVQKTCLGCQKCACGALTPRPSFLSSFLPAEAITALAPVTWSLALFFWEREVNGKNMARPLLLSPTNLFVCFSPHGSGHVVGMLAASQDGSGVCARADPWDGAPQPGPTAPSAAAWPRPLSPRRPRFGTA